MSSPPATAWRQIPASRARQAEQFQHALNKFIERIVRDSLAHMIAAENRLRLYHGRSWGGGESTDSSQGTLRLTSAESAVAFEKVMQNDVQAIQGFLTSIVEQISSGMKKNIYAMVSAAADSTGNAVSARADGSLAQAFLEMLQKIEFRVNAKGEITLPDMHISPEMGRKMLNDLQAQGPEFHREVERIKKEKGLAALQREQARLDKYCK